MEENSYLRTIRNYVTPSYGLTSYLNLIVQEHAFKKKETIKVSDQYCSGLLFISTGTLRLYTVKEEEETTILFWHHHQFLVPMATLGSYIDGEIFIEFLEDVILMGYHDKHTPSLYKIFPEYPKLINTLYQQQFAVFIQHTTGLARLSAKARFHHLMRASPQLFNLCDLKTIASYLGIHPKVLSRLRSQALNK